MAGEWREKTEGLHAGIEHGVGVGIEQQLRGHFSPTAMLSSEGSELTLHLLVDHPVDPQCLDADAALRSTQW